MNEIGIFICNYNGKEYVLRCIESLLQQTIKHFDIHVVDNASSDGTVSAVKKRYGDIVSILCNQENLGGAGGFERGLQVALEKRYKYIVLLDNDIILDNKVLENMEYYLDCHDNVGIVGSKVMMMDMPDTIQDYGDYLDFERFQEKIGYRGWKDSEELPEVNECDYVPSCAIMIRASMLRKSGTMPTDNFIYYDDIELSHKMALNGGKTVTLGNAKVWHKGGFRKAAVHTFSKYYFLRNRLHFFAKYIKEIDIEKYMDVMLTEVFSQLYGFHSKGMKELFLTTFYAFDDFLHQIRGKAADHKIMPIIERDTPFIGQIRGKHHILFTMIDNFKEEEPLAIYRILLRIIVNMQRNEPQDKLWISLEQCNYEVGEFMRHLQEVVEVEKPECALPQIEIFSGEEESFDLKLRLCQHVKSVTEPVLPEVYVDQFCNCITNESDYQYFTAFEINEKLFKELYRPMMERTIRAIREKGH